MEYLPTISFKKAIEALEKELITEAMKANKGIIAKAARQLNLTERVLSYKIKKYQMNVDEVVKSRHSRASGNLGRT
ncbi:MAG: helix-turn-helix domain-containing protein [Nitrospirae bacterium]|nr:helix-turn-helix domain-containing protein [Nitrospirota bacterium]MBI3352477.1 helix-turn-helix domain-containing protein [Nitrospirota bacterium]